MEAELKSLCDRLEALELSVAETTQNTSHSSTTSPFAPKRLQLQKETAPDDSENSTGSTRLPPVDLPKFDGDLEDFYKQFSRWLRLSGVHRASERVKLDWVLVAAAPNFRKLLEKVVEEEPTWEGFWDRMEKLFPKVENDLSIREKLRQVPQLPKEASPHEVEVLLLELNDLFSKLSPGAMSPGAGADLNR